MGGSLSARKAGEQPRLTTRIIHLVILCWVIPYLAISLIMIGFFSRKNDIQARGTITSSLENAAAGARAGILAAIESSRQASYDGVIKKSYEAWLTNRDEGAMYREVSAYLVKTYKYSNSISNTILLYRDPAISLEYAVYSNVAGATYANISAFRENTREAVKRTAEGLDTRTVLVCVDGHLYVVRNIVTSDYDPFATLVMEINMDRLFAAQEDVIWHREDLIFLEGVPILAQPADLPEEDRAEMTSFAETAELTALAPREGQPLSGYDGRTALAYTAMKVNGQALLFLHRLDRNAVLSDRRALYSIYGVVFLSLIPLLVATSWFFYRNINRPIRGLIRASEKIEAGEYGYRIEEEAENQEFARLTDTFNHMSVSLEESFRRIYAEEVAERDATLKALQSQINPHFLNNTLEIINWKSRMAGSEDVSAMIEALSVMMNATLNRGNESFIPLSEELRYVEAYFYIIQQRFGSKFEFEQEVDENLLTWKIPRLIIQPLVENAVEHGGDRQGRIHGALRIFGAEEELHIIVENNGELSEKDRENIEKLLSDEALTEGDRRSIGIRNVNLRLKMLYGADSGLTIRHEDGVTTCEIRIRQEPRELFPAAEETV